jgi:hypothetical protein
MPVPPNWPSFPRAARSREDPAPQVRDPPFADRVLEHREHLGELELRYSMSRSNVPASALRIERARCAAEALDVNVLWNGGALTLRQLGDEQVITWSPGGSDAEQPLLALRRVRTP